MQRLSTMANMTISAWNALSAGQKSLFPCLFKVKADITTIMFSTF